MQPCLCHHLETPPPHQAQEAATPPRLCSGCKNLHFDSMRHHPLDFQCLQTMMLLSELLDTCESAFEKHPGGGEEKNENSCDLTVTRSLLSPSEEGLERSEANAPNSSASVESSSNIRSSGIAWLRGNEDEWKTAWKQAFFVVSAIVCMTSASSDPFFCCKACWRSVIICSKYGSHTIRMNSRETIGCTGTSGARPRHLGEASGVVAAQG